MKLRELRADLLAEHLGSTTQDVLDAIDLKGSIIDAVEALRQPHRSDGPSPRKTLIPYQTPELNDLSEWLADNAILDPEGPDEVFESIEKRGLFRGLLKRPLKRFKTRSS